ncbi:MAG: undecaprenyl-phosphate glucose phosphotransferase [Chloroflexota bacterium]
MQQSLTQVGTNAYEDGLTPPYLRRSHRPVLMKRPQWIFVVALIGLDVLSTWGAYYGAHMFLESFPEVIIGPFQEFWPLPATHGLLILVLFFSQRMYQRRRSISLLDEFSKIIVHNTFAVLLTVSCMTLLLPDFVYHRQLVFYAWLANMVLLSFSRVLHARIQWTAQARGIGDDRVLVIGIDEIGQMMLQRILNSPQLGYHVVGAISHTSAKPTHIHETPVLGTLSDVPKIIEEYDIDEVVIGLPESSNHDLVGIISLCEREKVGIRVFPDVFQIMASEVSISDLGGLPLLTIRDVALQGWKLTLKRVMDIIFSAIFLIMSSPFLLLTALLVKLESPGPVFYTQERMGLDARPFKILKFRSMRKDAEKEGPGWTQENDPRRTRLGTLMRRLEIDEMPQLINVFIGDMSLVGPRPERPVYVEQFRQSIPRYMDRHREKAGMTGWAQVNGLRGDTSIAERTKYDLWYIENWSIALDIKIIIRTVFQVLFGTNNNAY